MPNDSPSADQFEAIPPQYGLRGPHRDLVRVTGTDDPRYVLIDQGDGVPALTRRAEVEFLPEGINAREAARIHLEAAGLLKPTPSAG